jgi:hypothetical protein
MRRRAMAQARGKAGRHRHNAQVLDTSRPFTPEEKLEAEERRALTAPITDFLTENGEDPYSTSDVPAHAADPFADDPNETDEHVDSDDDGVRIASMEDFI